MLRMLFTYSNHYSAVNVIFTQGTGLLGYVKGMSIAHEEEDNTQLSVRINLYGATAEHIHIHLHLKNMRFGPRPVGHSEPNFFDHVLFTTQTFNWRDAEDHDHTTTNGNMVGIRVSLPGERLKELQDENNRHIREHFRADQYSASEGPEGTLLRLREAPAPLTGAAPLRVLFPEQLHQWPGIQH